MPDASASDSPHTGTPPEDVFRHGLELLLAKDFEGWVDLWADDGTFEFPFAPPGAVRHLEGKPAIRAYMSAYPHHVDLHAFPDTRVHRTGDPDVVIAEMRAEGRSVATGQPFEMSYVAVVTVKNGLITHYRDYWNPLTALEVAGGTDAPFAGAGR
ncbi:nuclear transport factor 2 family protein [Streptomyces sp. NPDC015345]|uniref:nuclear transport factor 2 family protein n=1 Tax=Streptomyces sp. NPDC015345 TaxID=3364953 RepID=UPI0036FD8F13